MSFQKTIIFFIISLFTCLSLFGQEQLYINERQKEIIVDSSEINEFFKFLGNGDDVIKIIADGKSSGSITRIYIYKKQGIAVTITDYNPVLAGYKNGLVRNIELIDSAKYRIQYDDGLFAPVNYQTIISNFHTPSKEIISENETQLFFLQRNISFFTDNKTKTLIKILIWN